MPGKSLAFWREHVDELRAMIDEEGLSPVEAAARLDITHDAVIGKAKREGFRWRKRSNSHRPPRAREGSRVPSSMLVEPPPAEPMVTESVAEPAPELLRVSYAEIERMKAAGLIQETPPDAPEYEPDEAFWDNATIVATAPEAAPEQELPELLEDNDDASHQVLLEEDDDEPAAPRRQRRLTWEYPPSGGCHFPLGDPRTSDFRFCGQPTHTIGAPYCGQHHQVAYYRTSVPADTVRRRPT